MADLIGDDRQPSRRGRALGAVLVLGLGGLALTQHLSGAGGPPSSTPAPPTPSPSSVAPGTPGPRALTPAPPEATTRSATGPAPWASLAVRRDAAVDYAQHRVVRSAGRTRHLGRGDRALDMHHASAGPVLLVQSRGTTVLEQLRSDGSRRVLEAFTDESRLPQGIAVDPAGTRVVYAVTSGSTSGPFGLVVRDLRTGKVLASRATGVSFAVRGWVRSGVLLDVVSGPGVPPRRWRPGTGAPRPITTQERDGTSLFLLAGSARQDQWLVTGPRCAGLVRALGRRPDRWYCSVPLSAPAAWSPSGNLLVARGHRPVLRVLDLRTGRTTKLGTPPRVFVSQVTWRDAHTVLVALHTLAGGRGAVLRCRIGAPCRRLALDAPGPAADLVLAR